MFIDISLTDTCSKYLVITMQRHSGVALTAVAVKITAPMVYETVYGGGCVLTFRRNMLLPSSGHVNTYHIIWRHISNDSNLQVILTLTNRNKE
jgi:hypothetical protein